MGHESPGKVMVIVSGDALRTFSNKDGQSLDVMVYVGLRNRKFINIFFSKMFLLLVYRYHMIMESWETRQDILMDLEMPYRNKEIKTKKERHTCITYSRFISFCSANLVLYHQSIPVSLLKHV